MEKIDNLLIIKVGTSVLTRRGYDGQVLLDRDSFKNIASQVLSLRDEGYHIIIVSSAAVSAGMAASGLEMRPAKIDHADSEHSLKSLLSVGWRHILNAWASELEEKVAEILITQRDLEDEHGRLELLSVLRKLLHQGYIPVINENGVIAHEEISFGDNDILTAHLGAKLKKSQLFGDEIAIVLLSNIDGVYEIADDSSTRIARIDDIQKYIGVITSTKSDGGSGGMESKFRAAEIANAQAMDLYITNGRTTRGIQGAIKGTGGTRFVS